MMESVALAAGLLLPWVLGVALLAAGYGRSEAASGDGTAAWIVGAGYFTGAFLLTLALAWMAARRNPAFFRATLPVGIRALFAAPGQTGSTRWIWRLIVLLLAVRFGLLAVEVTLRPLYPWDAWIQWATKARVWYELGYLAPFARATEWFAGNGAYYFDASPEYPPTVPLLQVWGSLLLGRFDDALMNWPWWQIALALVFAVYGALRRLGVSALVSLMGAFMVASLPLANVHVALAGYADLPLAAYLCTGVLAFLLWHAARGNVDAALAIFLLAACSQIKRPGIFWVITVVPGVMVALFPKHGLKLAGAAFALAILLLAVLAQTNVSIFYYRLHLDFEPAWRSLGESFFLLGNWNLLWYGLIAIVVLLRRQLFAPSLAPFTTIITGGLLFLFMVFGFTNAREWMASQTTVNRATLHLVPLIAVFILIAYREFAARWHARQPVPAPAVVPAAAPALAEDMAPPPAEAPVVAPAPTEPPEPAGVVASTDLPPEPERS
jgi:hypothetical protein